MANTGKTSTLKLAQIAVLVSIMAIMTFTGVGLITIGPIRATTLHIPVIIGAIVMGPKIGALLGFSFGALSFIMNSMSPTVTSFVFTPLAPGIGDSGGGNPLSLVICFVPRILIGLFSGLIYKALSSKIKSNVVSCSISGIVGSLTNTILVLGMIYLFFGQSYAAATDNAYSALFGVIMGIVAVNGVPEAIVAALITTAIAIPLMKINKSSNIGRR